MIDPDLAMETMAARALGDSPPQPTALGDSPRQPTALEQAAEHAGLGLPLRRTRFMLGKRLFLRMSRIFLNRQIAFNEAVYQLVRDLSASTQRLSAELEMLRAFSSDALNGVKEINDFLPRQLDLVEARLNASAAALTSLDAALAEQRSHVRSTESRVAALEQGSGVSSAPAGSVGQSTGSDDLRVGGQRSLLQLTLRSGANEGEALDLGPFYAAFEDVFRGSEEVIRERQSVYMADLLANPVVARFGVLDVGCGRGEFLTLMREHGIRCRGIDLSPEFVEHNRNAGNTADVGEAVEHLRRTPKGSLGAVTALHIIEHLEHEHAIALLDAAHAALHPGGVLIIETPNPTNLVVGGGQFYLDPTHKRPVHPEYLAFAVGERGFESVEVRWLHPMNDLRFVIPAEDPVAESVRAIVQQLNDRLFGANDYAVLGRRPN